MYNVKIYIYTGDYTRSPVGESPRLSGEMQNWSFSKCPETFRTISVQPGQAIWNKLSFGAIQIFPLLQSFLYNCKAVSADIMPAAAARTWILLHLDE